MKISIIFIAAMLIGLNLNSENSSAQSRQPVRPTSSVTPAQASGNTQIYDKNGKLISYAELLANGEVPALTMSVWWRAAWMNLSDEEIMKTADINLISYYYNENGEKITTRHIPAAAKPDEAYLLKANRQAIADAKKREMKKMGAALDMIDARLSILATDLDKATQRLYDYRSEIKQMSETGNGVPSELTNEIMNLFKNVRHEMYSTLANQSKDEFKSSNNSQSIDAVIAGLYNGTTPGKDAPQQRFADPEIQSKFIAVNKKIASIGEKYTDFTQSYISLMEYYKQIKAIHNR